MFSNISDCDLWDLDKDPEPFVKQDEKYCEELRENVIKDQYNKTIVSDIFQEKYNFYLSFIKNSYKTIDFWRKQYKKDVLPFILGDELSSCFMLCDGKFFLIKPDDSFNPLLWDRIYNTDDNSIKYYIFTEKSYNENVKWYKEHDSHNYKDWQKVKDKVALFQGILIRRILVLNMLERTMIPTYHILLPVIKPNTTHHVNSSGQLWESNYKIVVLRCPDFEEHFPILVDNDYIKIDNNKKTLTWNSNKASLIDLAKYFKSIKKSGKGKAFWRYIVLLFGLANSYNNDEIASKVQTLKNYTSEKKYEKSDTLDILYSIISHNKK